MKSLWVLLASLMCIQIANGQAKTCADFNTSITEAQRVEPSDTREHSTGGIHAWGLAPVSACTYSHGSNTPNCNVSCDVTALGATTILPVGGAVTVELGQL